MAHILCYFPSLIIFYASRNHALEVKWTLSNNTMPTARADMAYGYNSTNIWLLGGLQGDYEWSRDEFIIGSSYKILA